MEGRIPHGFLPVGRMSAIFYRQELRNISILGAELPKLPGSRRQLHSR
jgi:hypothetical protein